MQARIEGGKVVDYSVFAEGFLDSNSDKAWGRPVDVQVMPDGALLVSDDMLAISSSICTNTPPTSGRRVDRISAISVEGVIG